ncbi:MAG: OmpA family protein [Candidatus Sumerlaeia bacterium]|nr:OmpA family protein [Candidatus Sumerlaeia bacterium]
MTSPLKQQTLATPRFYGSLATYTLVGLLALGTMIPMGCGKKKKADIVSILPENGAVAGGSSKGTSGSVQELNGGAPGADSANGLNGSLPGDALGQAGVIKGSHSELTLSAEALSKAEQNAALPSIYFALDSFELTEESKAKLQPHIAYLDANPTMLCLLEGHTDEQGTAEYNYALGNERSQAVRNYLVEQGIAAERLFTVSYGEDRPIIQGTDETSYQENRRVDFLVMAQ